MNRSQIFVTLVQTALLWSAAAGPSARAIHIVARSAMLEEWDLPIDLAASAEWFVRYAVKSTRCDSDEPSIPGEEDLDGDPRGEFYRMWLERVRATKVHGVLPW